MALKLSWVLANARTLGLIDVAAMLSTSSVRAWWCTSFAAEAIALIQAAMSRLPTA